MTNEQPSSWLSDSMPADPERMAAVARVATWVRETLAASGECAHGWLHADRVRHNILILARVEGIDPVLAELAALLHDVGRTEPGPEEEHGARSATMAGPILDGLLPSGEEREAVLHAIRWHNSSRADTRLLCLLRDADMLDGLGAMGILRAFMSKSYLPPYDPDQPFEGGGDRWPALYASDQLLGQIEWYERLNTETARQMAEHRIALMAAFVAQARRELLASDV
jgi:HD superfamily phosphodiesterase